MVLRPCMLTRHTPHLVAVYSPDIGRASRKYLLLGSFQQGALYGVHSRHSPGMTYTKTVRTVSSTVSNYIQDYSFENRRA